MIPIGSGFGIGACLGMIFLGGLLSFDWFIKNKIWNKKTNKITERSGK